VPELLPGSEITVTVRRRRAARPAPEVVETVETPA
jgi:hypothetical protein